MTLGEKLKDARQQFGWSQQELADKLFVSRAAIAKWETDSGIPDVQNLKDISALLQVSIDYLLDNNSPAVKFATKEKIDLKQFGKGIRKKKADKAVRDKYPAAEIHTLLADEKYALWERILLWVTIYIPKLIDTIRLYRIGEFYLVMQNDKHFIVTVSDKYIESKELSPDVAAKKFEFENRIYTDCGPIVYA